MSEWHDVLKRLSWKERQLLKSEGVKGRYTRKKIDLSTAQTDLELRVDGDFISIAKIISTSSLTVKLDNIHAKAINLREVREIESPFGTLYITTDGAGGSGSYAILYFGGDLTARIKPFENKVSQRNTEGTDVDLVQDKRFMSHVGAHNTKQLGAADTGDRMMAAPTKVKWAIISTDKAMRVGFTSTVHRTGPIGILVSANGNITLEYCDLYDVYFGNNVAGEQPTIQIEYVTEEV